MAKLAASREALDVFGSAVIITISDISKGWNWMLQSLCDVFHFRKAFDFRPIGSERVVSSTKDAIAKHKMLNTEVIFEKGEIICFAP